MKVICPRISWKDLTTGRVLLLSWALKGKSRTNLGNCRTSPVLKGENGMIKVPHITVKGADSLTYRMLGRFFLESDWNAWITPVSPPNQF